jgi:molybdenum cofactor biosynthesis enzyme MoaA
MSINKSTFCAAPWFQLRLDWDGSYRPCCEFSNQTKFTGKTKYNLLDTSAQEWMQSEYSTYLREQLTTGNQLAECTKCWDKEKVGMKSLRQTLNDTVTANKGDHIENTWVRLFVEKNKNFDNYLLKSADVKLSNVCNFSCAMCTPEYSSKILDRWEKDPSFKDIQVVLAKDPGYLNNIRQTYQSQRGYQHLKDILNEPITHLKVLGGEPLLDKELFKILLAVPKEKQSSIYLHFVTNGSKSLVEAKKLLSSYRSISFTVSLEGIGETQDYIRNGSNWVEIEHNILEAKDQGLLVNINHALQALSVINLYQLVEWAYIHKIKLNISTLVDPAYLSVGVLSNQVRKKSIENLKMLNVPLEIIDKIIQIIEAIPEKRELYQKFVDYIFWYEKQTTTTLKTICPEFLDN